MESKLNILFICSWYPSEEHTTIGNFIQRHAQAVSLLHNVTVLFATESDKHSIEIQKTKNVVEHRVYFQKKVKGYSYQKALAKAYKQITSETLFDLVHFHVVYPAAGLYPKVKIPFIVTEHFSGYHPISGYQWGFIKKRMVLKLLQNAKAILPVSNHLGKAIKHFGVHGTFQKVSNVVDTSIFFPDLNTNTSQPFTFLHVSSLEERSKNISGIIKAFKSLDDLGVDFLLQIGGDGDLKKLKSDLAQIGINPNKVQVFGESSSEEIAIKMRQSHALVMFSHFENQPCTILEALCAGLPVISSNVGGIPEEITSKNGILVNNSKDDEFLDALQSMMVHYKNFDRKEIAHLAMQTYSNESVAKQMSEIYFNVLNKDS